MSTTKFFLEFLKHWREVGSIAPSSVFLSKKILEPIDFQKARVIIELGAGTGSITKKILKHMGRESTLIVFEVNKNFCKNLKKIRDKRLVVVHASATHLAKYLRGKQADYIISGIPLMIIPRAMREDIIISAKEALTKHGVYIQFQYSMESYPFLKSKFPRVKMSFTPLNIPPAFIYVCSTRAKRVS